MSTEHNVYSKHKAREMLSSMKEMSESVRHAQTEKNQLLQVCVCLLKDRYHILPKMYNGFNVAQLRFTNVLFSQLFCFHVISEIIIYL